MNLKYLSERIYLIPYLLLFNSDKYFMDLVLSLLIIVSSVPTTVSADSNKETHDNSTFLPLPTFLQTATTVSIAPGELAVLRCAVENLGTRTLVWRRATHSSPLTVGMLRYVDDPRFDINHAPRSKSWDLLIKNAQLKDSGLYECQISAKERHIRWLVKLHVNKTDSKTTPSAPRIKIYGEQYTEKNREIVLSCHATGADNPPDEIDWFKNGNKVLTNSQKGLYIHKNISITTKTITSVLHIRRAELGDAGIFVCRTSDLQVTSFRVNVLNADTNNVKRGTEKDVILMSHHEEQKSENGVSSVVYGKQTYQFVFMLVVVVLLL